MSVRPKGYVRNKLSYLYLYTLWNVVFKYGLCLLDIELMNFIYTLMYTSGNVGDRIYIHLIKPKRLKCKVQNIFFPGNGCIYEKIWHS